MLTTTEALIAAAIMAVIIVFCRALPFLFFAGRKPPAFLSFVEVYMPAIAMTVLAVSSYTSIKWADSPHGIPELAAGALVVALHAWKRNALLSILGGTFLYMILSGTLAR